VGRVGVGGGVGYFGHVARCTEDVLEKQALRARVRLMRECKMWLWESSQRRHEWPRDAQDQIWFSK